MTKIKHAIYSEHAWDTQEKHMLYTTIKSKITQHAKPVAECTRFWHKWRRISKITPRPHVCCTRVAAIARIPVRQHPAAAILEAAQSFVSGITAKQLDMAKQRVMRGLSRRHQVHPARTCSPTCSCGADMLFDEVSYDFVCTQCGRCHRASPASDAPIAWSNPDNHTSAEYRATDSCRACELITHVCDRHRLGPACTKAAHNLYITFRHNMQHVENRYHVLAACVAISACMPSL